MNCEKRREFVFSAAFTLPEQGAFFAKPATITNLIIDAKRMAYVSAVERSQHALKKRPVQLVRRRLLQTISGTKITASVRNAAEKTQLKEESFVLSAVKRKPNPK